MCSKCLSLIYTQTVLGYLELHMTEGGGGLFSPPSSYSPPPPPIWSYDLGPKGANRFIELQRKSHYSISWKCGSLAYMAKFVKEHTPPPSAVTVKCLLWHGFCSDVCKTIFKFLKWHQKIKKDIVCSIQTWHPKEIPSGLAFCTDLSHFIFPPPRSCVEQNTT